MSTVHSLKYRFSEKYLNEYRGYGINYIRNIHLRHGASLEFRLQVNRVLDSDAERGPKDVHTYIHLFESDRCCEVLIKVVFDI